MYGNVLAFNDYCHNYVQQLGPVEGVKVTIASNQANKSTQHKNIVHHVPSSTIRSRSITKFSFPFAPQEKHPSPPIPDVKFVDAVANIVRGLAIVVVCSIC